MTLHDGAVHILANAALKALKDYEAQRKAGVEKYTFDPEALGIKNADFWSNEITKNKT